MDIETNIQIKEVCDTTVILRELNADEKVKQEAYYREKRLYDEASDLGSARREGIEVGTISILSSLVKDGILTSSDAAKRANMTVSEFEVKAGLR